MDEIFRKGIELGRTLRISYTNNFIFIHVAKNAGSSVNRALMPYARRESCGWWRKQLGLFGPINRLGGLYLQNDFRVHVTAAVVRRCLPREVFARAFKFAFVRNPWDRLVSMYAFLCRTSTHRHHKLVTSMGSFEEYLRWEIGRRRARQHPYITDCCGNLLVDFVGRFENIEADFAKVCQQLSVPATLPCANATAHRDYQTYYTPVTRELVAQHLRRDIEMFEYGFD